MRNKKLRDLAGFVIDSIAYTHNWGGDMCISLERINPNLPSLLKTNWGSCVDNFGGTPGRKNSIFTKTSFSKTSLKITPNPFSPDGDGRDEVTMINYRLSVKTAVLNLKIYDATGRLIRFLLNNHASGSEGSIPWNGLDDHGQRARIGIYVVYLEAINAVQGVLEKSKATVVLAGRL